MKKGLILINAYSDVAAIGHQTERLQAEFKRLGVETDVKKNGAFALYTGDDGKIVNVAAGYDFCVYLDKDAYSSLLLEKTGLRLFNRHFAVRACDDKMATHALLSENGVPMPATLPAPLCYTPAAEISDTELESIEKTLGYPVIVKLCYGSRGENVFMAENRGELKALCEKFKCVPHLYQRCVVSSLGKDVRVIVVGGKVIAAMTRVSQGDFRSNIELGGRGYLFDIPADMARLCEKTAKILQLDYCGIDVLSGENGYYICEVNSNAFFAGIEAVTGVNVAGSYAKHIYNEIYKKHGI